MIVVSTYGQWFQADVHGQNRLLANAGVPCYGLQCIAAHNASRHIGSSACWRALARRVAPKDGAQHILQRLKNTCAYICGRVLQPLQYVLRWIAGRDMARQRAPARDFEDVIGCFESLHALWWKLIIFLSSIFDCFE
jgi:hypothetical protein